MSARQFIPAQAIDRPGLLAEMDGATKGSLTRLVAPAGYGKSVLISQWVKSRPDYAVVWMNAVERDDDPVFFTSRLIARLVRTSPTFDRLAPLAALHDHGLGEPLREELTLRLGEVDPLVLVFDDLHRLSNRKLISDIAYLTESAPPNVHLIISSRVDPPGSWSGFRLRGEVTEIGQADLALSVDETKELIERVSGRPISQENATSLTERTEGWAAGVQLAGLSLRHREDIDDFIAKFNGSDRLVADYLTEEVLQSQTPTRRSLLLQFSAVDRLSAEMVQSVIPEPNARRFFDELERDSTFLIPLDDTREWYRFHHLFRDLLRYRLRSDEPGSEAELLNRAANWHLSRDEGDEAIDYLLRARSWDDALDAIVGRATHAFEVGETATVVRWLKQFPEKSVANPLEIQLLIAILRGMEGHVVEAEDTLSRIASGATDTTLTLCAYAFLAALAQWRPHPSESIGHATRALRLLEREPDAQLPRLMNMTNRSSFIANRSALETMILLAGGQAYFLQGDAATSRDWLQRALASDGATYSLARIGSLGSLALLEAWNGETDQAVELVDETIGIATDANVGTHPATADAYLALALIALDRHQPDRSAIALHEGHARAAANRRGQLLWICHAIRSMSMPRDRMNVPSPAGPPPPVLRERMPAINRRRESADELDEPLTEREKALLRFLPTLYTPAEIAANSFISVNTVKTHIAHIYRKLDVSNRRDAVARAHELGLLESGPGTFELQAPTYLDGRRPSGR